MEWVPISDLACRNCKKVGTLVHDRILHLVVPYQRSYVVLVCSSCGQVNRGCYTRVFFEEVRLGEEV